MHLEITIDSSLSRLDRILYRSIQEYYLVHEMSDKFMLTIGKDLFVHSFSLTKLTDVTCMSKWKVVFNTSTFGTSLILSVDTAATEF